MSARVKPTHQLMSAMRVHTHTHTHTYTHTFT